MIVDWKAELATLHRRDYASHKRVPTSPASQQALSQLEDATKLRWPREFHELYLEADGFGIEVAGEIRWIVKPLSMMVPFFSEIRDCFQETHASEAGQFYPFYDWLSGDAIGYLAVESGRRFHCGLYEFSHEDYEFEKGQPIEEFIRPSDNSLIELIRS